MHRASLKVSRFLSVLILGCLFPHSLACARIEENKGGETQKREGNRASQEKETIYTIQLIEVQAR